MRSQPLIGELFAGYGGLGMGVQSVYGGQLVWYSEFETAPSRIMAHHYPTVPNLGDITRINWSDVQPVDILTGGFPCQDVSGAGRRAGMRDGTRSGLWSHMLTAIENLQPDLVVIENVRGLFTAEADSRMEPCAVGLGDGRGGHAVLLRAFDSVLGSLADIGYDAEWTTLRAADVGAPHGRARVFVTAHPQRLRSSWRSSIEDESSPGEQDLQADRRSAGPTASGSFGAVDFGEYQQAVDRWASAINRPAPAPTEQTARRPRLSAKFAEWMMGLPVGHVTGVPGVSRSEQIKALGNGVVPQQAAEALRWLHSIRKRGKL